MKRKSLAVRFQAAVLSLFLGLGLLMPLRQIPVKAEAGSAAPITLRVATWNIAANKKPNVAVLSKQLADNGIEIAGLQELDRFNDRNNYDMLKGFESETYPYTYFAKGRVAYNGDFGVGVVSQFPILEASSSPIITPDGDEATKTCERVLIEKEGKQIAFYNVHLSVTSMELRRQQSAQILKRIQEDPAEYKIIVGDFNSDQNYYEYSLYLDEMNMANGQDGKWLDTYNLRDDANMKVWAVDNILTTKNIRIHNTQMIENQLSDHNMLMADLELLDQTEGSVPRGNIALGQPVTAEIGNNGVSPLALTDHDLDQSWETTKASSEIIISLDQCYLLSELKLVWGTHRAASYTVSTSLDGINYTELTAIDNSQPTDTVTLDAAACFIKVRLDTAADPAQGFSLNEIQAFGTARPDLNPSGPGGNILPNGDLETSTAAPVSQLGPDGGKNTYWDVDLWEKDQKPENWVLQIYKPTNVNVNTIDPKNYAGVLDTDCKEGQYSVRIEKKDNDTTYNVFFKQQTVNFTLGQTYVVSFWYKTEGITDKMLRFTSFKGQDKVLPLSEDWTRISFEITAKDKAAETVNIRNDGPAGSYWIDDFKIEEKGAETHQYAETLRVSVPVRELKTNETTQASVTVTPDHAEDQEIVWKSSDLSVLEVDADGRITAKDAGYAYVSAVSVREDRLVASAGIEVYSGLVDTSKLKSALKLAEQRNENDYTAESWVEYQRQAAAAKDLLKQEDLRQSQIDQALATLNAAQKKLVSSGPVEEEAAMYAKMRDYWREELTAANSVLEDPDYQAAVKKLDAKAQNYYDTMNDPQSAATQQLWSDEAFLANEKGALITETLDRMKIISIQTLNPYSAFYQNREMQIQLADGLQFVVEKKYNKTTVFSGNWWDQDIGVPKSLVDNTILLYDIIQEINPELIDMTAGTIDAHIPTVNRRGTSANGILETGANLIDKVAIVIKRASLNGSHERLEAARNCMAPLFELVKSNDGFYADGSFIFHSTIAYNGSYGAVLVDELVNCAALLSFTDIPLSRDELTFLNTQVVKAFLPIFSYGGNIVDSVRGRAVARIAQQGNTMGSKVLGTLLQYADIEGGLLKQTVTEQAKLMLDQQAQAQAAQDNSLLGYSDLVRLKQLAASDQQASADLNEFHMYSYMNKMIAARPKYTVSVSMSSNRIRNAEQGNSENTKGYYQGQGMTQIYTTDVNQYNDDYWATVDAYRLPGTTTGHQKLGYEASGQAKWAGGTSLDGSTGIAGQILSADKLLTDGKTKSGVEAYKSWIILDDRIVMIGSDIHNTSSSVAEVETILDNRRILEGGRIMTLDGQTLSGEGTAQDAAYVIDTGKDQLGYIVLDGNAVHYLTETRQDKWYSINQLGKFTDHDLKTNTFASLAISHGQQPTASSYQVMMVPEADGQKVQAYADQPQMTVLKASDKIHVVRDEKTGQEYYNFFIAGTAGDVSADQPISLILKETAEGLELAAADPTLTLSQVKITIKNFPTQNITVLSGSASADVIDDQTIEVTIPFDVKDGMTRTVTLGAEFAYKSNNLALNKTAEASSTVHAISNGSYGPENAKRTPDKAVDGRTGGDMWWASEYRDVNDNVNNDWQSFSDQWLTVDLGSVQEINQADLYWNNSGAKRYDLQVALENKEESFVTVYQYDQRQPATSSTVGQARMDSLWFSPVQARYVRMRAYERNSDYWEDGNQKHRGGYNLFEIEIYNSQSVRHLVSEAEALLENYPRALFANLSDEEYQALKEPVSQALSQAEALMAQGRNYTDEQIQAAAAMMSAALENYRKAIIPVTGVSLDISEITLNQGDQFKPEVTVLPENATLKEVQLTSGNQNAVVVAADGTLHAVGAGDALVTAVTEEGEFQASVLVHVQVAPKSISLNAGHVVLLKDETFQLTARVFPAGSSASGFEFVTSNPDAVQVDDQGLITAVSRGRAEISVKLRDSTLSALCVVEADYDYTAASENKAALKVASASLVVHKDDGSENPDRTPDKAVDGVMETRWASQYKEQGGLYTPEEIESAWFMVDLGEQTTFNQVKIFWEAAKGKDYDLQISDTGAEGSFTTIYEYRSEDTSAQDRNDVLDFDQVSARYVRMQGIQRSITTGGYSIYEFEVYDTHDYFSLMKQARETAFAYAKPESDLYQSLTAAIAAAEALTADGNFDSAALYQQLTELRTALNAYLAVIVKLESVMLTVDKTSVLPGETVTCSVSVDPQDAWNQEVDLTVDHPEILAIQADGTLMALQPGQAVITAVSQADSALTAAAKVTVRTNSRPQVTANDLSVSQFSTVDVLSGIQVLDEEDGELAVKVLTNPLTTEIPGVYTIEYSAVDSDGNEVRFSRKIIVLDDYSAVTTVQDQDVTLTGIVHPRASFHVTPLANAAELGKQVNRTGIAAYELALTIPEGTAWTRGQLQYSVPLPKSKQNIHVFVLNGGQAAEAEHVSMTNQRIRFTSPLIGTILITGDPVSEVIPEPNPQSPAAAPESSALAKTAKPKSKSDLATTDEPSAPESEKETVPEVDEPEVGCRSSDCGENQPAQVQESNKSSAGGIDPLAAAAGIVSVVSLSAAGGWFFLRKRKLR